MAAALLPTGRQIVLESDGARAEIGTVAAVLRSLTVNGVAVTEPFPADAPPPFGDGIVLVPWPNRVRDARWMLDGEPQLLDVTEPDKANALHGLLRYADYEVREQTAGRVTLGAIVPPQRGWPFLLDTWVRYELRPDGITVTHGVTNHADRPAPYAAGTHPFLRVGETPVEDLVLTVAGSTYFEVDDRLNPIEERPVEGTPYDLQTGRRVGDLQLDTAYGGVTHRNGAAAWLTAPDGATVELVQDVDWGYVQVFTTRRFPDGDRFRLAVAVEPMTAPPDALNSGQGLQWIEPGASSEGSWGIRYTPSPGGV